MEIAGIDRRKAKLSSQISLHNKKRTNEGSDSLIGLTVDAVLGHSHELAKPIKQQQQSNTRTLLDIISDEESGAAYRGLAALNGSRKNKKKSSKKSIKDRLKFRRPGSSWSSSSSRPVPTSDFPLNNRRIEQISDPILIDRPLLSSLSLRSSIKLRTDDSQISDLKPKTDEEEKSDSSDEEEEEEEKANPTIAPDKPVEREKQEEEKEKLPSSENELKSATPTESEPDENEDEHRNASRPLISEPDDDDDDDDKDERENELGPVISESVVEAPTVSLMALLEESGRRAEDDDDDEEDDEEEDEEEVKGVEYVCTVCMVKHRGLAFVPCGHTFCRLCSKELWVSRGNCPLCTGYILEILDIF